MAFLSASATQQWTEMWVKWANNLGHFIGNYPVFAVYNLVTSLTWRRVSSSCCCFLHILCCSCSYLVCQTSIGLPQTEAVDWLSGRRSQIRTNHSTVFRCVDALPRISLELTLNRCVIPPQIWDQILSAVYIFLHHGPSLTGIWLRNAKCWWITKK